MSVNEDGFTIGDVILEHLKIYKLSEISDIVKLIYQNEFGGGHMIKSPQDSLEKLKGEISKLFNEDAFPCEKAFEQIGNGLCRANLRSVLVSGISAETLNNAFVLAANTKKGSIASFKKKLSIFENLICDRLEFFSCDLVRKYLEDYEEICFPAISHSVKYRKAYKPAYRVVDEKFSFFSDLFIRIDRLLLGNNSPIIVCIDGRSASGKSTLGKFLANVYNCNLFHTDDFFLRPEQRTKERLEIAGGNLDYERIIPEIFEKIVLGEDFSYRRYNCSTMCLEEPVPVTPTRLNIVEGAYSTSPKLDKYCDAKIFLSLSSQVQDERILLRNGKRMHKRFINEWIPMEETYFQTFGIVEKSDLFYDMTK